MSQSQPQQTSPFLVEFTGALERALAFATTGSGRVLHKGVMDGTYLSKGILATGFPAVNRYLYCRPSPMEKYTVNPSFWPSIRRHGHIEPITGATGCLEKHYSIEASTVGLNCLCQ